jgi:hypothetical protein
MIRLGAILWLSFAVVAGVGLFQVKYEVQALEEKLTSLHRQILSDQKAIHVLRAEWSYLNEPARLTELSRRHLDMAPVTAAHLTRFEDLPEPLPIPPLAPDFVPRTSDAPGNAPGSTPDDARRPDETPTASAAILASTRIAPRTGPRIAQ